MVRLLIISISLAIFANIQYRADARSTLKIVNGTTADEGEFPYMVQLRDSDGFFLCGGGIIASEWIISAAHCVDPQDIDSIVYGTNKLYDTGSGYPNTSIKVKMMVPHPKYTYTPQGSPLYDIGLLQLEQPIPFSANAQPIQLAAADATIPFNILGVLSGWGVNETEGDSPPYLQKINLQLLTDEECTEAENEWSEGIFIPTHHLCSDDYYNGECFGDSGSPFVINATVYGLSSWSFKPCGVRPGAYSRITNPEYRNWIKNVTNI